MIGRVHIFVCFQVLLTVNDRESLGTQLLAIAGQRVAHKLTVMDAQQVVELMSNLNPALSTWLRSMVSWTRPFGYFGPQNMGQKSTTHAPLCKYSGALVFIAVYSYIYTVVMQV